MNELETKLAELSVKLGEVDGLFTDAILELMAMHPDDAEVQVTSFAENMAYEIRQRADQANSDASKLRFAMKESRKTRNIAR